MQEQIRVESFVPVLSEQTKFFTMGNDAMGFESPTQQYGDLWVIYKNLGGFVNIWAPHG